jgi:FAD:protein FMN transferase
MADCFHFEFVAMGSPCELALHAADRDAAETAAGMAIAEVRRLELKYSRYRPDSYMAEINAAARSGTCVLVDEETADLIDHASRAYWLSDGLFDVTCGVLREVWNDSLLARPAEADIASSLVRVGFEKLIWSRPKLSFSISGMELDFGGIVKEYAADQAARFCLSSGVSSGLVNLGGDIAVIGRHPGGAQWRIGITDPFGSGTASATLFVSGGGVATSGTYERYRELDGHRYSHVLNPKTGWPVEGLPSVTVASESCLTAGMYSTIALLMGRAGPSWLRSSGLDFAYIDWDGVLHGSVFSSERPNRIHDRADR